MFYLKEIINPEPGTESDCIVIFYESRIYASRIEPGTQDIENRIKKRISHCEMFPKSRLTSLQLNEKSFVLRFNDRNEKRSLLLHLTEPRAQIEALSDTAELCLNKGLIVMNHFAKFLEANQTEK